MLLSLLSDQPERATGRVHLDLVGRTWAALEQTEWLLTNGIGGYASGTISGANTRRYHGLLVAAFDPPGDRRLVFSKIDERLRTAVGTHELATNEWQDQSVSPKGYRLLTAFSAQPHPTWTYEDGGVCLTKEIILLPGQNTVQVRYRLASDSLPAELDLIWLVNHRDPHGETDGKPDALYQQMMTERGVLIQAHAGAHPLALAWERGVYKRTDVWHYRIYYAREAERGQWATEDLYNPGITTVALAPGDSVTVTVTADGMPMALPWQAHAPALIDTGSPQS
ncbi:MAG: glycogen debranching enzyme N-terminal domain-containing protein, partial [Candidatus Sericytochromatia bacterium]|nr:glycogen debranching enzyme N-terminal domain-containing protein [Candidatus Sericytochromatia bacterium]